MVNGRSARDRSVVRGRVALFVAVALVAGLLGGVPAEAGFFPPPEGTGSIAGTVVDAEGQPVEGVTVYASGPGFVGTETGSDGTYLIDGLPAGYFVVAFEPSPGSTLAGEYYDDSYVAPTPVQVVDDEITGGIDAELAEGAVLSGTITDPDGLPYEGAEVYAEPWGVGVQIGPSFPAFSGPDGTYSVAGLAPGYYRVHVAPEFPSPYPSQYYDGVFAYYEATPVPVPEAGIVEGIDVQFTEGGSITGTVTDGDGAPLSGVQVSAEGPDFAGALTGTDGTYLLTGLAPGTYRIRFQAPVGYISEYYDNVTDLFEATPVVVEAEQTVSGIDAALDEPAAVAGQVIGLDGLPDSGVPVVATTPGGGFLGQAITNFNGQYFINDLPAGDAIVSFVQPFNTQYYDGAYRRSEATPVDLVGGEETTGIDAAFEAIVLGSQLVANDTTVESYCFDTDELTFTFDVADFDSAGGATAGRIDFGDGSPPWDFDAAGDSVEHTFPDPSGVPTPPAYEVTLTLLGASGLTDSISLMPGGVDCRPGAVPQIFSDVPPSSPFYAAIQWMAQEGITSGFSDGTFRPRLDVTREGVAAWLYGFAGSPPVSGPQEFSDVPPSSPFYAAIQWMAQAGITSGFADGTFKPRLDITREGVAAWLHQYDQTLP